MLKQQIRIALNVFLPSRLIWLVFICLFFPVSFAFSQEKTKVKRDSITRILKSQPSFSIYKDNYFITGTTLDEKPNKTNSDIKMQISFKQRVSNSVMPFKSYLYLTYTQKSFWKIYEHSSPFQENIFNPGLGLGKFIFKDRKQIGVATFQLEHESNGRDSAFSRSLNYFSLSYMAFISTKVTMIGKCWLPFSLSDNNDITDYIGYGEFTCNWEIVKDKFQVSAVIRKGAQFDLKGSIQTNIYYNPLKNSTQYLYLQVFNGYAENLLNYDQITNMVRIGLCIRPNSKFFNH